MKPTHLTGKSFSSSAGTIKYGCHENKMATPLNVLCVEHIYFHMNMHFRLYKTLACGSRAMAKLAGPQHALKTLKIRNWRIAKLQIVYILFSSCFILLVKNLHHHNTILILCNIVHVYPKQANYANPLARSTIQRLQECSPCVQTTQWTYPLDLWNSFYHVSMGGTEYACHATLLWADQEC